MILGFLREISGGISIEKQELTIYRAGYHPDDWILVSSRMTSTDKKKRFEKKIKSLREGDTLVVSELSRLGHSVGQIAFLIKDVLERGAILHCLKENIQIDANGTDVNAKILGNMFPLLAEVEQELINERTKVGIEKARKKGARIGRPKGSRSSKLDKHDDEIRKLVDKGVSKTSIAKILGVSWPAIDHYIKTRGIEKKEKVHS